MVVLEQHGIDAGEITLMDRVEHLPPGEPTRTTDQATGRAYAMRFGLGAIVGGAVGAAVFAAVVALFAWEPLVPLVLAALVTGGIVGFYLGGFANVARSLPVNADALETFGAEAVGAPGPFRVAVYAPDDEAADDVMAVLRPLHPEALEREKVEGRHLR